MIVRGLRRPFVLHVNPAPQRHLLPQLRPRVEVVDHRRQRLLLKPIGQQPGQPFHHRLRHAGGSHADRRRPAGDRLDEHLAERLLLARADEQIGRRIEIGQQRHVRNVAHAPDVGQRERLAVALLPQAHHRQIRKVQTLQRVQRQLRILAFVVKVAGQQHDEPVFRQPQNRAARPAVFRLEHMQREVQPELPHRAGRTAAARNPHRIPRELAGPRGVAQQHQLVIGEQQLLLPLPGIGDQLRRQFRILFGRRTGVVAAGEIFLARRRIGAAPGQQPEVVQYRHRRILIRQNPQLPRVRPGGVDVAGDDDVGPRRAHNLFHLGRRQVRGLAGVARLGAQRHRQHRVPGQRHRIGHALMRDPGAVAEAVIVQHRDPQLMLRLLVRAARPARAPGAGVELIDVVRKLGLELRLGVGLLLFVNPEPRNRAADHVDAAAGLGHADPQIVVHAVVKILADLPAGALPDVAGEHHFGLIEKLSGVPAAIEVQQIVERQRSRLAAGHVMRDCLAAGPERDDARHQIGPRRVESHGHRRQSARRQHVVTVQPGQNVAGGQRHALVDRVALAFVFFRNRRRQHVPVAVHDGHGRILRAAVHHDVLDARIALAGDGKNRLLDVLALIVGGRDDRDQRPALAIGQRIWQRRGHGGVGPFAITAHGGRFVAAAPLARGLCGGLARRRRVGGGELVVVEIVCRQLCPALLEDIVRQVGGGTLEAAGGAENAVIVLRPDALQKTGVHPVVFLAKGVVDDDRRAGRQFVPSRQRLPAVRDTSRGRMERQIPKEIAQMAVKKENSFGILCPQRGLIGGTERHGIGMDEVNLAVSAGGNHDGQCNARGHLGQQQRAFHGTGNSAEGVSEGQVGGGGSGQRANPLSICRARFFGHAHKGVTGRRRRSERFPETSVNRTKEYQIDCVLGLQFRWRRRPDRPSRTWFRAAGLLRGSTGSYYQPFGGGYP